MLTTRILQRKAELHNETIKLFKNTPVIYHIYNDNQTKICVVHHQTDITFLSVLFVSTPLHPIFRVRLHFLE